MSKTEMCKAFPDAMVEVPSALIAAMTNHPGDRHVVAAAIVASAQVIVTFNLKHFLNKDLQHWNVEAKSPDAFLTQLYDLSPELTIDVLQQQSQERQHPFTILELLERLKKVAPYFGAKVQSQINS